MRLSPRKHPPHPNWAQLALCLLWSVPGLGAQASAATLVSGPTLQAEQPSRATPGKQSGNTAMPVSSAGKNATIRFENVIESSKIKFKLKNSVSPQRYTFETDRKSVV